MSDTETLDLRASGKLAPHLLRRLDQAAARDYQTYNEMIAALSFGRERDVDWWVCRPASRNNHISDLYRQCMQLALVRELLDEGHALTVLVDSAPMAEVLQQRRGPNLKVTHEQSDSRFKGHLRNIMGALYHTLGAALGSLLSRGGARPLPSRPLTVLNTFFMPDSAVDGAFKNPDYPGILEALSPAEQADCHFLPTFYRQRRYVETFRALRKTQANFLFREDYLTFFDYFYAFGHWLRAGKLKDCKAHFAGFEVGRLVDADIQGGRFASTAIVGLLSYRFLRAAPQRGIRIRVMLDWYEGMDVNRGTAAAVNWHQPGIDLIGFRSAGSFYYMSATPAAHEAVMGVMPKTIAAVGRRNAGAMQALCPAANFITGPGFRYRSIAALQRAPAQDGGILVAMPMFIELARDALAMLTAARRLIRHQAGPWWIKCHPGLPPQEIKVALGIELSGEFIFVDGSLYDWLPRANIVVGMGSSALIEAVALGIPTICLTSGNCPTEIPIPPWVDNSLHCVAYDANELADAFDRFQQPTPQVDTATLQADLLSPASPAAIRKLLKLD